MSSSNSLKRSNIVPQGSFYVEGHYSDSTLHYRHNLTDHISFICLQSISYSYFDIAVECDEMEMDHDAPPPCPILRMEEANLGRSTSQFTNAGSLLQQTLVKLLHRLNVRVVFIGEKSPPTLRLLCASHNITIVRKK